MLYNVFDEISTMCHIDSHYLESYYTIFILENIKSVSSTFLLRMQECIHIVRWTTLFPIH